MNDKLRSVIDSIVARVAGLSHSEASGLKAVEALLYMIRVIVEDCDAAVIRDSWDIRIITGEVTRLGARLSDMDVVESLVILVRQILANAEALYEHSLQVDPLEDLLSDLSLMHEIHADLDESQEDGEPNQHPVNFRGEVSLARTIVEAANGETYPGVVS